MSVWRALRYVVFVLALAGHGLHAQAPAAPPAAIAAARAAMTDTVRGASLHIALVTVGQGTEVYERFGHNMLWVRDDRTGESVMWNWGMFDFAQPDFIKRFLFGNTRYWMEAFPANWELIHYDTLHRDVRAQDLALTAGQRAALDAFLRANADTANRYYRYDYYLDNCSTRVRDALDIVLGGAISAALVPQSTTLTYRSETLRLNQGDAPIFLGMDLALGAPSDRTMNAWQAAFIPMRLRDELRNVQVKGPDGVMVPLVQRERVLLVSGRSTELSDFSTLRLPWFVVGATLVLTLLVLGLGALARQGVAGARPALVSLAVVMHAVAGLLATFIVFVWLFTLQAFWAWNQHLLLFTPLSFGAVVLLLWRGPSRAACQVWVERYHLLMAGVAFLSIVATLLWYRSHMTATAGLFVMWANAAWMLNLALAAALTRGPIFAKVPKVP